MLSSSRCFRDRADDGTRSPRLPVAVECSPRVLRALEVANASHCKMVVEAASPSANADLISPGRHLTPPACFLARGTLNKLKSEAPARFRTRGPAIQLRGEPDGPMKEERPTVLISPEQSQEPRLPLSVSPPLSAPSSSGREGDVARRLNRNQTPSQDCGSESSAVRRSCSIGKCQQVEVASYREAAL